MECHPVSADDANGSAPADKGDLLRGLRKKLARLQQSAAPQPAPDAILYRRDLPREAPRRVPLGGGICIPLEKCIEGRETPSARGPAFYLIEQPAAEAEALPPVLLQAIEKLSLPDARLAPEHVRFLDVETTGLGTAVTFLIGTLVWQEGGLVCRQFLARTYAEEASILERFAEEARRTTLFVTFNGKTFDVPSLRARAAATGVALPEPPCHLDLLHEARRRFKDRLPDCRLQTLERYVCGRHRSDDIPGSDIGRAYHDFVRTGDARELALIVQHNRWDLVTMAHLLAKMFGEEQRNPHLLR